MTENIIYRRLPISGALNIRDIGGYPAKGGKVTAFKRFLRADAPVKLPDEDVDFLVKYGVKQVIDLRTSIEIALKANSFANVKGVEYLNVSVLDVFAIAVGNVKSEKNGINTVDELYKNLLDRASASLASALRAMSKLDNGITLYHCTAGKDRTGVLTALLLSVAGVSDEDIIADYQISNTYLFPKYSKKNYKLSDKRLKFMSSKAEHMREMLSYLMDNYGGAEKYLSSIGITLSEKNRLINRVLL